MKKKIPHFKINVLCCAVVCLCSERDCRNERATVQRCLLHRRLCRRFESYDANAHSLTHALTCTHAHSNLSASLLYGLYSTSLFVFAQRHLCASVHVCVRIHTWATRSRRFDWLSCMQKQLRANTFIRAIAS